MEAKSMSRCKECGHPKSDAELVAFDGFCTGCWEQFGKRWDGQPARTWMLPRSRIK